VLMEAVTLSSHETSMVEREREREREVWLVEKREGRYRSFLIVVCKW
jgi:hypothetical protein